MACVPVKLVAPETVRLPPIVVLSSTFNVESKSTASSAFNSPKTVVKVPGVAMFTSPPAIAKDVVPLEIKVVVLVCPETAKVPLTLLFPPTLLSPITLNSPPTFKFPATPAPPATVSAPVTLLVDSTRLFTLTGFCTCKSPWIIVFCVTVSWLLIVV